MRRELRHNMIRSTTSLHSADLFKDCILYLIMYVLIDYVGTYISHAYLELALADKNYLSQFYYCT